MRLASRMLLIGMLLVLTALAGGAVTAADAEQQVQFSTPIMVANTSFLNVRTGPGVRYEVLLTVVGGTDLPVLGVANDRVWYQVSTVVGVGWVNSEFVIPRGDFSNIPMIDTSNIIASVAMPGAAVIGFPAGQGGGGAAPASVPIVGGLAVVGTDVNGNPVLVSGANERFRASLAVPSVELRRAPGDNQPSLGTLYQTENVDYPVVGSGRDAGNIEWLAIATPLGTGWVDTPKLQMRLSGVSGTVMVISVPSVAMGDGPGSGSTTLPVLTGGTEAYLRNISGDGKFIQIELIGGEVGWVPFDAARQRTENPTDGLAASGIFIALDQPGQGGGGVVRPTLATPRVIINTAFLNVRSGPGAQYSTVTTLSGGTELPLVGIARDRVWYLVEGSFGRGWINNEFVIFRGVIDNVPIINADALTVGQLDQVVAVISAPTPLYAAPGTNFGSIGVIGGPAEIVVVARTADNAWVQVSSQIGFGWALASQVLVRGDLSRIPIVGG